MKKRGMTLIETVVAITIFLIGIIPIAQLTLNSLRQLKRASEIEEGARVASTVINYIKSQGYDSVMSSGGLLSSYDKTNPVQVAQEKTYVLEISDDGTSYILDTDNGDDFELDFFGQASTATTDDVSDALFLINSLGISSDIITIVVNIATSDLKVAKNDYSAETTYINPISNNSGTGIIIGNGGLIDDPIIYGNIFIEYETLSNSLNEKKDYSQNFIITPLENFKE